MGRNLEDFVLQNYRKAIEYHEIQAYYQPVVRTSCRKLCSFEALARWIDPEIGMIYPDEFIPGAPDGADAGPVLRAASGEQPDEGRAVGEHELSGRICPPDLCPV